jgi:PAT family acetyl-CoA transporter-like MFS transporter 1
MYFFGIVFVVSTTLVLLFKHEINQDNPDEEEFTVKETYLQMWKIVWLAPIKKLALILLTIKVSAIIIIDSIEFFKQI